MIFNDSSGNVGVCITYLHQVSETRERTYQNQRGVDSRKLGYQEMPRTQRDKLISVMPLKRENAKP